MGYPCVGSWVTYGLGCESDSLPSFVVMSDPLNRGLPKGNASNWGAGFLPSVYQGTWLRPQGEPIDNLRRPEAVTEVTRPTFWIVKKQNAMNNRTPAQINNLIDMILTVKNADPMTPNTTKMSGSAELNIWINLEQNSCLDVARQKLVKSWIATPRVNATLKQKNL